MIVKNRVEYLIFQLLLLGIRLIPNRLVPTLGHGLGSMLFFLGVRRRVALKNLEIAFGHELTAGERKALCKKTYQNYGIVLFEVLLLHYLPPERISAYIELEGLDVLNSAIAEGKGVVLAGNHFGNWELTSAAISCMGAPIHVYAGRQRNSLFDKALNSIRERFGTITISKSKTATIEMLKVLKESKVLGMAGDLNVPHNKLFVDFFGKKAAVGRGLATYTLSRQCPLLFIWSIRTEALRHKGFISRVSYHLSGDKNQDLQAISQALTHTLEEKIRDYPDQYFWFNKRWKTRPLEDPDSYIYDE